MLTVRTPNTHAHTLCVKLSKTCCYIRQAIIVHQMINVQLLCDRCVFVSDTSALFGFKAASKRICSNVQQIVPTTHRPFPLEHSTVSTRTLTQCILRCKRIRAFCAHSISVTTTPSAMKHGHTVWLHHTIILSNVRNDSIAWMQAATAI